MSTINYIDWDAYEAELANPPAPCPEAEARIAAQLRALNEAHHAVAEVNEASVNAEASAAWGWSK